MTSNDFARPDGARNGERFIDKVHKGHLPTGMLCVVTTVTGSCEKPPVIDPQRSAPNDQACISVPTRKHGGSGTA